MNAFVMSYAQTALWASLGPDDESLDLYTVDDIDPAAISQFEQDCESFLGLVREVLASIPHDLGRVAHDFWLTRNHHGAGFWDGDYPEPAGAELTKWAHSFGSCDLYLGDDGNVHAYP